MSTDATLGRSASTITYSSLSRTNLQLTLTHCCSAAAPTMLLMTPMLIALLLLPDDTTHVSVKQREAWWGSLPIANRGELSLPGCSPQLADRRLLDLLPHHPIVSAKAAEASKLAKRARSGHDCGRRSIERWVVDCEGRRGEQLLP